MNVRKTLVAALACAALGALPTPASAMIQLQRGIAGAAINNTQAQVRAALGTPTRVRHGRNDFSTFTEFTYAGGITVFFQGNTSVTQITTTGLGDRTARGVGVGSMESTVRQRVPGVTCRTELGVRHCQLGQSRAGRRVTDFFLRGGRVTRVVVGIVID